LKNVKNVKKIQNVLKYFTQKTENILNIGNELCAEQRYRRIRYVHTTRRMFLFLKSEPKQPMNEMRKMTDAADMMR